MKYLATILFIVCNYTNAFGFTECLCAFDWANDPRCCRSVLVYPEKVTGFPCYGPFCRLEETGAICNCNASIINGDCDLLCKSWILELSEITEKQVYPTRGLCFGSQFPFDEIAGESFVDLYGRVIRGTGAHNLGPDHALCHWEASWATIREQDASIESLWTELLRLNVELDQCLMP